MISTTSMLNLTNPQLQSRTPITLERDLPGLHDTPEHQRQRVPPPRWQGGARSRRGCERQHGGRVKALIVILLLIDGVHDAELLPPSSHLHASLHTDSLSLSPAPLDWSEACASSGEEVQYPVMPLGDDANAGGTVLPGTVTAAMNSRSWMIFWVACGGCDKQSSTWR
jgi:hypothetical protein